MIFSEMTHNNDDTQKNNALVKIEALQIELQTNPKSLSFAQLADLYLAQNMNDAAEAVLVKSLKYHPQSVSGHMLLGRVFQLKNQDQQALDQFNICINKAPTNWACILLRAQIYLKLQKNKLALQDFKMVMLHNPKHVGVRKSIARLEMLTADEYDEDLFEIKSISEIKSMNANRTEKSATIEQKNTPQMQRVLSLIDAFIQRQDYEKAIKLLKECRSEFGDVLEIQNRLLKLSQFENPQKLRPKVAAHAQQSRTHLILEKKEKVLKLLLRRIQESKISQLVPE
jgi:tetratricopeptide (TPR) repeat protein